MATFRDFFSRAFPDPGVGAAGVRVRVPFLPLPRTLRFAELFVLKGEEREDEEGIGLEERGNREGQARGEQGGSKGGARGREKR